MNKNNISIGYLTKTAMLLALAVVFQVYLRGLGQTVVGPAVNLILILSAIALGPAAAVIIGCFTPVIAFLMGVINIFALIPLIIGANLIYVISFSLLAKIIPSYGETGAVIVASVLKYLSLTLAVNYILQHFVEKVPPKIIASFSLTQLYTALAGGIMALIVSKYLLKSHMVFNKSKAN